MEIIPLIKIKSKKILDYSIKDLILNKNFDEKTIYILDYDGINKNKPNLCTYQKLSKHYDIWVDFAPKNIGDVVDSFMTGAKAITIRNRYYKLFDPRKIKEISENNLFLTINDKEFVFLSDEISGYVSFKTREEIESDFKYQTDMKQISKKLYIYEKNPENKDYWEKKEIKGLLVDFNDYERFK